MRNVLFKGIAVAATAAALGTAGTAVAGNGFVQVKVCNVSGSPLQFVINGINQHDDLVNAGVRSVGAHACTSVNNWWFRRFTVSWGPKPPFGTNHTQDAPRSGDWVTVNINWPR